MRTTRLHRFILLIAGLCLFGLGGPAQAEKADGEIHYNRQWTTKYGPAAADIMVKSSNMMTCKPPTSINLAYALCFYSGPPTATGVNASTNPALPCVLSKDGKSANCTCLKLTTAEHPVEPYIVDINAILNLDVYKSTVKACGHDGSKCGPETGTVPPACTAVNQGTMMPKGNLVSVFSLLKAKDYSGSATPGSTSCSTSAKYAGCMTAPCVDTGKVSSTGQPVVECKCPIYTGPYQVGEANAPCQLDKGYVWSAGYAVPKPAKGQ